SACRSPCRPRLPPRRPPPSRGPRPRRSSGCRPRSDQGARPEPMKELAYVLEFEKPLRELAKQLNELRQQKIEAMQREIYSGLTPWQKVQIARHPKRPYALDYVNAFCEGFQELHGDRQYHDDRALIGGTAFFDGQAVMIVAQ